MKHSSHNARSPWAVALIALSLLTSAASVTVAAEKLFRRPRGDGLFYTQSANTMGSGNVWVTGRAHAFIWDDDEESGDPNLYPFPEMRIDAGILDFLGIVLESRLMSYPDPQIQTYPDKLQFGYLAGALKATIPNNKDLRYNGLGLELRYCHSFVKGFASIGGYRTGGTGFSPEGWLVEGGTIDCTILFERDYIARYSAIPLKVFINGGIKIPVESRFRPFSQYQFSAGLAYAGLNAEAFVEYSLVAFFNKGIEPKKFEVSWPGWQGGKKTWEVAFSENPMYLTLGGKVRYPRGISLNGAVPILLSMNRGSDITDGGDFPDEARRGITDPFDPWYAKWKLIGWLSFPIHYRQTGAEMRRTFLLMKNKPQKTRIDIDERLRTLDSKGDTGESEGSDRQKRLEAIKKRRENQLQDTTTAP